jgi:diguanylate cyclase (GGDEF)-like protein
MRNNLATIGSYRHGMAASYDHSVVDAISDVDAVEEQERLAALDRYDLLDTPPEESFDRITRLTRRIFNVGISTVTLIDGHRQWFKSRQGVPISETDRAPALCNLAIRQSRPLIIPDALADVRVSAHPFVVGAPFLRFYAGAQLRTADGHAIGTLCAMDNKPRAFSDDDVATLVDLARIVMDEAELRAFAMSDSLTGALSRRAFRTGAVREIELARRHKHDLSCVVLDLDHFKAVNDTHGHGVGDLVLRATVDVCREELSAADMIGRLGGEEFAVLLPHTSLAASLAVAEKLRAALSRAYVQSEAGTVRPTASFGIAAMDASVTDIDELMRRADRALYAAKDAGRNTCRTWQPDATDDRPGIRRRVLKGAQVAFNGGRSTVDCTVRELSNTGALLHLISTANIPEEFKLSIAVDQLHRLCKVAARRDTQLEVEFR